MANMSSHAIPYESGFAERLAGELAARSLVEPQALDRAMSAVARTGNRLDRVLLDLGIISEVALRALAEGPLGAPQFDGTLGDPTSLSALVSPDYAIAANLVPVAVGDHAVSIAMLDPFDDFAAKALALKLGQPIRRLSATRQTLLAAFEALYGFVPQTKDDGLPDDVQAVSEGDLEAIRDSASDAPVIKFVQTAVRAAIDQGASDIHIRPWRNRAEMLFRIDGALEPQPAPDVNLLPAILSRLKILANLDISERRLPQDGRIRLNIAGQPIDMRLATMPQIHGEGAVLRLLSRDAGVTSLAELGFSPAISVGLEQLFEHTSGMVLVTGPTGSGKSTTLHAALKRLIRPHLNVVTIEDPVEYRIDGASQIQVDEKIGLTFPRVLRSVLRQDPDIILIGEIRDAETARIAVQAALTGHLVLATLHTNSAMAAVPRLIDMGVEPYLLAAVLRGVLSQRLVRRICQSCRGGAAAERELCSTCGGTGSHGRVAIGELISLDDAITGQLATSITPAPALIDELNRRGYVPLAADAAARVANGDIAASELAGVLSNAG